MEHVPVPKCYRPVLTGRPTKRSMGSGDLSDLQVQPNFGGEHA
ncbi:hypothetical protein C791_8216 [Amycolatopsis azurea DSM 43854]|uniref:Uncharacterized protein n=1 Tax=Amycolatopsis azurea DSM 43854 TaxID=1238180 RepID=M2Q7D9_9PSEU|nr:hypothetical protein C791_8216 [Amycolatopsis azurea DSM 43854]